MFNLNNPKLTKQEKVFLLSLQTDSKFKKEVDREKAKGNNICFPSYWVVNTEDLIRFNRAAHQIDTAFDFYKEWLELIFPYHQNLLFEGERVEIGEWDKTYERWSPHSYQRVGIVLPIRVFGLKDCNLSKNARTNWKKNILIHLVMIKKYIPLECLIYPFIAWTNMKIKEFIKELMR